MVHDEVASHPIDVIVSDFETSLSVQEYFPLVSVCPLTPIDCIGLTREYIQNKDELREIMRLSGCPMYFGINAAYMKQVISYLLSGFL